MDKQQKFSNPEIWGGIECTINRVDEEYYDQLAFSNYYGQPKHASVSALGIKKLRFPVLWERHQPSRQQDIDWTWTEEQLNYFRGQGIDVIAGLVHHGSGPSCTDLTDPEFPYLLAEYAGKVAEKFPWLEYYTPVNEPLTTARFSGLYGLWYPHANDDKNFITCLFNQVKGIVLSMEAIRKVNPDAKLVQTEDLGKTYSTPKLRYQSNFENQRRWLTYDLLCGRVDEKHKLWKYFIRHGASLEHLRFFQENVCVPDIFGWNHYVTSERYLDENLRRFPKHTHGGNKKHRYADVEAVRVEIDEPTGLSVLLKEAWDRYGQPMAVTEVHLHCHREEQIRWFTYVWNHCNQLRDDGVDIVAVTAWAIFGSFGWNELLTKANGFYEPGVYDISSGKARPTALASFIRKLNTTDNHVHFLSHSKGWWERSSRFIYSESFKKRLIAAGKDSPAPLLIIGKKGTLGQAFARACKEREIPYLLLSRQDCDIADKTSIEQAITRFRPWAIINCAGYVRVDDAEEECDRCLRENLHGPMQLAKATTDHGIKLVTFSSDLVFDGSKRFPYIESDAVNPLNMYGRSKADAEMQVLQLNEDALVIRTSAFFGPWDRFNFNHWVETSLMNGQSITVAKDIYVSPTYVPDLVHTALDLLIDGENGIWHLANEGAVTWAELAHTVARHHQLDRGLIISKPAAELKMRAARPLYSVLSSEKTGIMPALDNALGRYFEARKKTGMFA